LEKGGNLFGSERIIRVQNRLGKARSRENIRREIDTYFVRTEMEKVDGRRGSRFEGY